MLRRLLLALCVSTICVSAANADVHRTADSASTVDSVIITIPNLDVRYTKSISFQNVDYADIGVMYKATSSGTVGLTVDLERSFTKPTIEGQSDTQYIVTDRIATTLGNQEWHMATINTVLMPYARFKIQGTGSNSAVTTLKINVGKK